MFLLHFRILSLSFKASRFRSNFNLKTQRNRSTIYALSSGQGKCGVAVVRLSGPSSPHVLQKLTQRESLPKPRYALYTDVYDVSKHIIDKGLVLWFPGPHSFTGEDSCEFQLHGGPAVVAALFSSLVKIPGLEPAQPGDFTKRAFEGGKLDLTEVEGLADLIHAETEGQRRQAVRQLDGVLAELYSSWRQGLTRSLAHVEAYIDFSEEEQVEDGVMDQAREQLALLKQEVTSHISRGRRGERLRSGVKVAILGQPNAGKSSLLNEIVERPAAIVSPIPGTTRDIVESTIDLGGYPLVLSDTAGLRRTSDVIEREGVRRARERALEADLWVLMVDTPELQEDILKLFDEDSNEEPALLAWLGSHLEQVGLRDSGSGETLSRESSSAASSNKRLGWWEEMKEDSRITKRDIIVVFNKLDLLDGTQFESEGISNKLLNARISIGSNNRNKEGTFQNKDGTRNRDSEVFQDVGSFGGIGEVSLCAVSCMTGQGMAHFIEHLQSKVKDLCGEPGTGEPTFTQARHRHCLLLYVDALSRALQTGTEDSVAMAHHVRVALRCLGQLTGTVTTEDVLDVVFKDFCIGK